MSAVSEMLRAAGACDEAVEWAEDYETPQAAWEACTSVEWLCWWIDRCGATPQRHELIADFAADCLAIYERHDPGDTRVRDCISARRAYARGEITEAKWGEARAAVWDAEGRAASCIAAMAAARAATWDASGFAASDSALDAAWSAAWDSARAASLGASRDATRRAARADAKKRHLLIILQHYPTPPTPEAVR